MTVEIPESPTHRPERTTRGGDSGPRVAQRVREAILSGEYPPGARIRQEDIADRFGASRLPVREALRILEHDGLVKVVPNTGAWVAELTLAECSEIYQIRERLEPLLLRYSSVNLTGADLDGLDALAKEMEHGSSLDDFLDLDRQFHLSSYAGAETTQLGDLVARLWNTTQPYRRAYSMTMRPAARRMTHDEHHMIVCSLRTGDIGDAEAVLASHLRRTRRELERHPHLFEQVSPIPSK